MKAPIYLALAFGVANGIGGGGGAGADERRPGVGGVGSGGKRDSIGAVGPGRVRDRGSIGGKFRPEQVGTGSAGDGENGPGMNAGGGGGGGGGGGLGLPEPSLQEIIEVGAEADNLNPNDVRATAMLLAGSYLACLARGIAREPGRRGRRSLGGVG